MDFNSTRLTNSFGLYSQVNVDDESLTSQTLMVIDDNAENLDLMKTLFGGFYQVVTFENAIHAISYAQQNEVDLILLDINMPDMHGYEACSKLKSTAQTSHIPIIFVTAASGIDSETKGLSLGAVDYITKPMNLPILKARVRNHMISVFYRKALEKLSSIDCLTGLPNRRYLDEILQLKYNSAIRFAHNMTLMMIDIDNFKEFNDEHGHQQGDECLSLVAKCLSEQCRETDFIGRYGGEEFVMVLPDTDLSGGLTMAHKLLHAIRKLNIHQADQISKVTISIGLVIFDGASVSLHQQGIDFLLRLADEQLYKAKRSGKNKVCHSVPLTDQTIESLSAYKN